MNIYHLEVLARLMEHGSLSRAAKELGVSQPTVTIRLRALEQELGVSLFDRSGNKITVSPAGRAFYEYAQRSLRVLNDGLDHLAVSQKRTQAGLSLAGTPTIMTYFLTPMIGDFIRQRPDWHIPLHIGNTLEVVEMLFDEVAHAGFIGRTLEHPDMVSLSICKYPLLLAAAPSHPLSRRTSVHLLDLQDEPFLICDKDSHSSSELLNLFREHCLPINIAMELNHSDAVKRMVAAGNGIAFLPAIVMEKELESGEIIQLPLQLSRPLIREIHLVFWTKRIERPALSELIHHLLLRDRHPLRTGEDGD